jgi:selenide,water dikinase
LCDLELAAHPNLIVGIETSDDAGVYRLTDDVALIQTVDFFTPITDDPYLFGQIAAANALSDVYAMGGRPLTAMNLVCFPVKALPIGMLQQTLRGGLDKVREAGAVLVGGHSVEDKEYKYGLSVTGVVHPDRVVTNRGARNGDRLVLTKPVGTGVIATAVKADLAPVAVRRASLDSMARLNRVAAETMRDFDVHACTDVTGFGLTGHLLEMLEGADAGARIRAADVPVFEGVEALCESGLLPGGLHRNRKHQADRVDIADGVPRHLQDLLHDPQTSGGLLIAVAAEESSRLVGELHGAGVEAAVEIGEIVLAPAGRIVVR